MNSKLLTLILTAATTSALNASGAVVGPYNNYASTIVWPRPDINGVDAAGLATRGLLYYDLANPVGAIDRLRETLSAQRRSGALSDAEADDLFQVLTVSEVYAGTPQSTSAVEECLHRLLASPHRSDLALLLADLILEQGQTGTARLTYEGINVETLSPALRPDYFYHRAYTDLLLANYDEARQGFDTVELLSSAEYGNAARFYLGYISYIDGDYAQALDQWDKVPTSTLPGSMADYYRAQISYYQGRYDEALRLALPLLDRKGVNSLFTAEANRIVGEVYYQKDDMGRAIPYLRRYISAVDNPELSTLYILGLAEYQEGDYTAAVESLTPVTVDQSAMGQNAYLYIGQAMLKVGDDNAAIIAFNRALSMNYDPAVTEVAYYNYAVAKSRGANVPFASSVTIFEDFLTKFPNSRYADDVARYIVTGYVTDGNYEAALASIDRIKKPSDDILAAKQKILYTLGSKQLAADNAQRAISYLEQAKKLSGYDKSIAAETSLVLGEAYYRVGQYDAAASELLEYISATDVSSTNHAIARYDLGYTRMAQKDWGKAQLDFERLLAHPGQLSKTTLADAQTRLGDVRYYQRDWEGAALAYQAAFDLDPDGGDYPLYQKAVMQGYSRDYNGKLTTLARLQRQFPTSAIIPDAMMEEAEAYIQLKEPDKADNTYRKIINEYGQTSQGRRAYLFLASDLAGNDKTDEAIQVYQQLIRQAPTSEEAVLADEAVKRLHAERGTLNEYSEFISSTGTPTTFDAEEAETLSWNAAEHAYLNGKGTALLEKFVSDYPTGTYSARGLAYLLDTALDDENENATYKWASLLVENYPDNVVTEQALVAKADIEYSRGHAMDALRTWQLLDNKASTPENRNIARMGIMRVARETGDAKMLRETSEALMKSSTLGAEDKTEVVFSRALAMSLDGETDGAITVWKELAVNADDLYGAKAAVFAAEALNATGRYDEAAKLSEDFVNSGTPQTYWLARGFIALSDAYAGQGRTFEAKEYIKALKENYPGNEADIFDMIEERLK
ncbi:MAG: tetratricopeptide repeat protein [Muribaculaceae bacterium]|nr:tetratricopeptide repeat protein [Muribaculaceae bacterium]